MLVSRVLDSSVGGKGYLLYSGEGPALLRLTGGKGCRNPLKFARALYLLCNRREKRVPRGAVESLDCFFL